MRMLRKKSNQKELSLARKPVQLYVFSQPSIDLLVTSTRLQGIVAEWTLFSTACLFLMIDTRYPSAIQDVAPALAVSNLRMPNKMICERQGAMSNMHAPLWLSPEQKTSHVHPFTEHR